MSEEIKQPTFLKEGAKRISAVVADETFDLLEEECKYESRSKNYMIELLLNAAIKERRRKRKNGKKDNS